ncbi:L-aspartate oxidase [Desulfogranum mediterraneum]|uniref:L-aspartate oxidase n=1 Tax=Desulfogranum mediterraneum TaxID=160661 RepID=UPI00042644E8|nr:L-aspartate oxidase [Desulfogranum mediterraneum]
MAYDSDVLVIGSGVSGLSFALKVARFATVTVITKKAKADTATNLAQGGVAAVLSVEDSIEAHVQDTLVSGDGLCDETVVRMVAEEGPDRVRELMDFGVRFQKGHDGEEFDLGMEGGHSARRVAHAHDLTGREIERALLEQIAANPKIEVLENHLAIDLLVESRTATRGSAAGEGDRCLGAYVLDRDSGEVAPRQARVTVLCTGGCGKVYLYTTNPDIATGDGVAMAYRAGAKVANLEFIQFHPTCFFNWEAKNFLISEAVRGEGGVLVNEQGRPFMKDYDSRGDLATRDAVARGIDAEMKASGADCVYLDISHRSREFLQERFPNIYQTCDQVGLDISQRPIPVVPAAHYMCGGVVVDSYGQSSLENLLAFGETACTGLHGANRLASNSLLEAVVFAHRGARMLEEKIDKLRKLPAPEVEPWRTGGAASLDESILINHNWDQVRRLMWNYVGIVRSTKRLELMHRRLEWVLAEINEHFFDYLLTPDLVELRNLAVVADLIVRSASLRKESRGLHYSLDYPEHDPACLRDTILHR